MNQNKTQKTGASVTEYLEAVENEKRKQDSFRILEMMTEITGEEPKMWGGSLIGFGEYHYKGKSGREGDWFKTGFSPRKQNLSLYIMSGFDKYENLTSKLGKYKTGRSCLYINKLEDVDIEVLKELIKESYENMNRVYGGR